MTSSRLEPQAHNASSGSASQDGHRPASSLDPFVHDVDFTLWNGDALQVLERLDNRSVTACVTSPPYLDARPEYPSPDLNEFFDIFNRLRYVVSGAMLLNVGRIWRESREVRWWVDLLEVAIAAGWDHLDTRVWIKPNANPIRGQVFTDSHEYIFVMGRPDLELHVDSLRTPYAEESVARLGRQYAANVGVKGYDRPLHRRDAGSAHELGARPASYQIAYVGRDKGNPHPAPMPLEVAEEMILLSAALGETVIDPFAGSGTTALAARRLGRRSIGIELNPEYCELAARRLGQQSLFA